jgi:hypothetical protein
MKKEEFRRWLSEKMATQCRLTMGSLGAMVAIGLIATLMEFGLFYLIIKIGFIGSGFLAAVVTVGLLGAVQGLTLLQLRKHLPDSEHEVDLETGHALIRVAPNMTDVWTYAFGSLDGDRSWQERLIGILTLPQRMCSAAWFTWNRLEELKTVAVEPCAAVIRLLHKEGEGVEIGKIEEDLNLADLQTTIRHISLIDGVTILSRRKLGLSLAPRLVDDIVEWKKNQTASRDAE